MRNEITGEMSICQAENGFSLDELAKKWAHVFFFTKFRTITGSKVLCVNLFFIF